MSRHHTITTDVSWLRGERETVYQLRCYGMGAGVIGEGGRTTFRDMARAVECGRTWDVAGLAPADQPFPTGLTGAGERALIDMAEAA